jgi:hypothetical protein
MVCSSWSRHLRVACVNCGGGAHFVCGTHTACVNCGGAWAWGAPLVRRLRLRVRLAHGCCGVYVRCVGVVWLFSGVVCPRAGRLRVWREGCVLLPARSAAWVHCGRGGSAMVCVAFSGCPTVVRFGTRHAWRYGQAAGGASPAATVPLASRWARSGRCVWLPGGGCSGAWGIGGLLRAAAHSGGRQVRAAASGERVRLVQVAWALVVSGRWFFRVSGVGAGGRAQCGRGGYMGLAAGACGGRSGMGSACGRGGMGSGQSRPAWLSGVAHGCSGLRGGGGGRGRLRLGRHRRRVHRGGGGAVVRPV